MSTSTLKQPPYTYDIVGSFLRPERLKNARAEYAAEKIDQAQLTAVEDECIAELVQKEKAAGLRAVTDGEFRRAMWHLDFLAALNGVEEISADTWSVEFKGPKPKGAQLRFTCHARQHGALLLFEEELAHHGVEPGRGAGND